MNIKEGMNKKKVSDKDKVLIKIKHNLSVLLSPEKVTPEYIERLKKKYENCTGKVYPEF